MKKGIFYLLFTFFTLPVFAQVHELGIGIGGLNYKGELAPQFTPVFTRPAFCGFYRYNLSPAFALRADIMAGAFHAKDAHNKEPLPQYRNLEVATTIIEFAAMGEYNFFNYRKQSDRRRYSPYFTGGIAFFSYSFSAKTRKDVSNGSSLSIPFGVGLKYRLSNYLNLGVEFVARKTFTDYLDGLASRIDFNGRQIGDKYSKDWYYFMGFTLSYTFYGVRCPDHYR